MASHPKKIAFVYDAVYPFIKGGAERRFYEIGKRLAAGGCDVHFYGMKSWPGADIIAYEGMTLHGICANYPLYTDSGRRSIYQALMFGLASFSLWREPLEVVDCCGFPYFSLFPLRAITWIRRKKLYSTWHEVWGMEYWRQYLGPAGFFGYLIERLAALMPDTIISVSESTDKAITAKLGRKKNIVRVANGLDMDKIKNIKPSAQSADVIYAGRLVAHKNIDVLIRAVGLLAKDRPDISLAIIGDGPERKNLEKLAGQPGIAGHARFIGFVDKEEEVYARMKAAKISVLPSAREGFGIIVLEANACGLPVVTADCPQNSAKDLIVEGVNGSICRLDETVIAQKIAMWLEERKDPAFYQSYAGNYDWNFLLPGLSNIYFS